MPNTFLTPDIIANEALMVLENSMVMSGLAHLDKLFRVVPVDKP